MFQPHPVHPFGFVSETIPLPRADLTDPASLGVPAVSAVPPPDPEPTTVLEPR
jgi:hypothetical protein